MAFDLGMLGSMVRGGGNAPAPSHGAGPGPLQELGRMKISQGYLDLQRQQEERLKAEHAYAQLEGEKKTRQAAIDAWLSAVRSGNRADIFVLGKRLKGMGINVQMPDAFSASGIPSDADLAGPSAAPDDELGFTLEERSKDEKLGKEITARGKAITDELQGGAPQAPPASEPFRPTRPDGTPIAAGIAQGALQGIQPLEFGAPSAVNPFGPGGPSAVKPPANTWRVSDPVTGTDLEIAPEQILADQEKEIDQTFLPLINMPGLDPIAARGYQIGHEFAKGQIGFKTPAEATKAGMDAADRYMNHMYKKGLLDARAMKVGRGGGGGAAPTGPSRLQLAQQAADRSEFDKVESTVRQRMEQVYKHNDYAGALKDLNKANSAFGRLGTNTSLGDLTAFREQMTTVESRLSNADAAYYEAAGGAWNQLKRKLDYVVGQGRLTEADRNAIRGLLDQVVSLSTKRMKKAQNDALGSAKSYLDARKKAGLLSDEEVNVQMDAARGHIGGGAGGGNASTQKAKGLL